MTGFAMQARTVASRDLARERRTGEVLWVTVPFGAIALLLIPLAIGTDTPLLARIGPGLFWVVVMLFGVLVSIRQTTAETEAQRDQLRLTGIDPAALYAGRVLASFTLLVAFEVVLAVVTLVLYDAGFDGLWPTGIWLIPVSIVVVAAGLSLLGALAASIVASARSATALVPLLVAPLSIPLLIGATQALEALRLGRSSLVWVLMMIVTTLVLSVVGVLAARPLQETG